MPVVAVGRSAQVYLQRGIPESAGPFAGLRLGSWLLCSLRRLADRDLQLTVG